MENEFKRAPISDDELGLWAKLRADDAGHIARELLRARRAMKNAGELLRLLHDRPTDRHRLKYTNYRGETSVRELHLCGISFGSTEWHPEPQLILKVFDWEKDAYRDFAVADFDLSSGEGG